MTTIDIDSFLAEISPDAPCGEDISYDAAFMELERRAQGTAETQIGDHIQEGAGPDWKAVRQLSMELLERSRDLRVILYLTASSLRLKGLPGFRDGLALLQGTVEQYWEHLHPQLDPEDDNDPLERINIISALSPAASVMSDQDSLKIIAGLMETPLCEPEDARLPQPNMRHILIASGELSVSEEETSSLPNAQLIDAAFEQANIDHLRATDRLLGECSGLLGTLDGQLTERVGAGVAPNLENLVKMLKRMQSKIESYLQGRGYDSEVSSSTAHKIDADGPDGDAETPAGHGGIQRKALSGQIVSDRDVLKALDMIITYYEQNEPSSPLPLIINRARRLVGKSFVDIILDLSPDAMSQIQKVSGKTESSGE